MKYFKSTIVLLLIWTLGHGQIDIEDGLIFYYPFDGTCEDMSVNGLDCIPGATPAVDRFGNTDGAYSFNGINQIIQLPNDPLLKPQFPMALSFWVLMEEPTFTNSGIFNNDHIEDFYSGIWVKIGPNTNITFGTGSGGPPGLTHRVSAYSLIDFEVGRWYHCVMNITDAMNVDIWVDCNKFETNYGGNGTGIIEYTQNPGIFGRIDNTITSSTSGYFHGSMDDFYFWNRILTSDEIEYLSDDCCVPSIFEIDTTICIGDVLIIDGYTYNIEGSYQIGYLDVFDCDSIISIDLGISGNHEERIIDTSMCGGDFILIGNEIYLNEGNYFQNHQNLHGCDSTILIFIEEMTSYEIDINETICQGDTFTLGSQEIVDAGNYTAHFSTIEGCDSVVFLDLEVDENFSITNINEVICEGEAYEFGSQVITASGVYIDTVLILNSCDSITTLTLVVESNYQHSIDTIICEGDFVLFDSHIIDASGTYSGQFLSINHCDSIVNLIVKVEKPTENHILREFCKGDTLTINNQIITVPIIITEIFSNQNCDSLVIWDIDWYPDDTEECMKLENEEINIYIPNAFTPNGDGINDFFNVFHSHDFICEISQLEIYDRWGSRVVVMRNIQTNNSYSGWNGRVGDEFAQNGVYVYHLQIGCNEGFTKDFIGDICLLR